jgi:hypothetical protein
LCVFVFFFYLESNFNLRHTTGRWWHTCQIEFAQQIVYYLLFTNYYLLCYYFLFTFLIGLRLMSFFFVGLRLHDYRAQPNLIRAQPNYLVSIYYVTLLLFTIYSGCALFVSYNRGGLRPVY